MRKRLVRLHMKNDLPSLEGLCRTFWTDWTGSHYVVELAKVVEGVDRTITLEGGRVRVPRENVAFLQELR